MNTPIILAFAGYCPPIKPRAACYGWRVADFPEREDEDISGNGVAEKGQTAGDVVAALSGLVAGLEWLRTERAEDRLAAGTPMVLCCPDAKVLHHLLYADLAGVSSVAVANRVEAARGLLAQLELPWRAEEYRRAKPDFAVECCYAEQSAARAWQEMADAAA